MFGAQTMNIDQAFVELEARTDFALSLEDGAVDVEGLLLIQPLPDGCFRVLPTGNRGREEVCDGANLVSTVEKLLGSFVD